MAETDDLLQRIDDLFPEGTKVVDPHARAEVRKALDHRFGDALRDLGLEALIPVVKFGLLDGPVVVDFPVLGRKEFDKVLLRLEDLARARTADPQGRQNSSLFT